MLCAARCFAILSLIGVLEIFSITQPRKITAIQDTMAIQRPFRMPDGTRYTVLEAIYGEIRSLNIVNQHSHSRAVLQPQSLNSQTDRLTLSLFVFRVFTDYSDASLSFNNLAFFADRFY